jgi:bis(5'-nucleosidyl)-tetraphosphatase
MKKEIEGYREGITIVTYKIWRGKPVYLLLKRKLHWTGYELPKGGVDKGETSMLAVLRELKEETNLIPLNILNFHMNGKYLYDKKTKKERKLLGQTWSLYSANVEPGKVKLDKKEHNGYLWLPFEKAIKMLTWEDQKKCLKKVNDEILNGNSKV